MNTIYKSILKSIKRFCMIKMTMKIFQEKKRKKKKWVPPKGSMSSFRSLSQDDNETSNSYDGGRENGEPNSTSLSSSASSQHSYGEEEENPEYEDSDDEEQLQRYKIDFSDNSLLRKIRASNEFEDAIKRGKVTISFLIQAYQQTRIESRRNRVEALLSVNTKAQRLYISIRSYFDLYDRGLPVLLVSAITWLLLTVFVLHWTLGTSLGVIFLIGRLSTKPFYWYIHGRHLARKRKQAMEIYEELNQMGMEFSATPNKENHTSSTSHYKEGIVKIDTITENDGVEKESSSNNGIGSGMFTDKDNREKVIV